ncbi:protein-methionine-sulfoxide reductase catalytic subunit MsrP [Vibrio sp. HA2012]|uniref:protein-methionine-sulfoxide reductase catalytic subunit MsrP n=1 Tax=Vibrio sp. HA2012 TaxID=1971595 RepID=UPI000C2C577F|nr:protein-methionine-sulfoxide reductase catalytic subunit MsrP [Vibrio sp. HA2012]PJC87269.1 protein-methionine-sulfoxide reductase catalytic subunit MsrP [Vibrio sp. HA2012]
MLIRIRKNWQLTENQTTADNVYHQRRKVIKQLGLLTTTLPFSVPSTAGLFDVFSSKETVSSDQRTLLNPVLSPYSSPSLELTPESKVLSYNNYYEFGTAKHQPAENSGNLSTEPWQIRLEGEVHRPFTLDFADLLKQMDIEERIYRFRCVEAWSMNIPWLGFPLNKLINMAKPTGNARYVALQTLFDPEQMPGQKDRYLGGGIDYPYIEALTIPEAMHPLTIIAVGLYGKTLAPQNGAPLRLVIPWKYGFKSIKSIVKITLTEHRPPNTWNLLAPHEYGFYANVNPKVDHPRWSQASERFIGAGSLFSSRRKETLMFNGYADEVSSLYSDIDLTRNY